MPWYNYFLISLPEIYTLTLLGFIVFGISVKSRWKQIHNYSIVGSLMSYFGSIFVENPNYKLCVLLTLFLVSFWIIFRFTFKHTVLVVITSTLLLMIYQMIGTLVYSQIMNSSIQQLLENEWQKIALTWVSLCLIYVNIYLFSKYKLHIRFAGLSELKK